MSQRRLAQAGWTIKQDMIQCFTPAFSGSNGYVQVFLYFGLPDKVTKLPGAEA